MTRPEYTPAQVRAAREAAGHTQTQAAAVVYRGLRSWQKWELDERDIDPAVFEFYLLKTGQKAP